MSPSRNAPKKPESYFGAVAETVPAHSNAGSAPLPTDDEPVVRLVPLPDSERQADLAAETAGRLLYRVALAMSLVTASRV
jgi:hypothetical protein